MTLACVTKHYIGELVQEKEKGISQDGTFWIRSFYPILYSILRVQLSPLFLARYKQIHRGFIMDDFLLR